MKLLTRVLTIVLIVACIAAFFLDWKEWVLPIAAIACVMFFIGLRADLVKTRDESVREATESEESETQM